LTELEQEQQPSSHKDLDRVSSTVNTEQGCLEPDSNSALQDQAKLPSGAGTKNGWNGRGSHSFAIGASINKEGAAAGLGDRQKLLRGSARSKSTTMTPNPDEARPEILRKDKRLELNLEQRILMGEDSPIWNHGLTRNGMKLLKVFHRNFGKRLALNMTRHPS